MRAWASRMPASAVAPRALSRSVFVVSMPLTSSNATISRPGAAGPERSVEAPAMTVSVQRQIGATTLPGAAAMPWSCSRRGLLVEVTVDQVAQRRDGIVSMRAFGADDDGRALGDAEREDAEDALGVPRHAILEDLNPGVLESGRGLHEKRGRPRVQADLVGDGQRSLQRSLLLLASVVCPASPHRSSAE